MAERADFIVIGGGMFGAAIAVGLARRDLDVAMLDEGDEALRAARANFGLVWAQSKGLGLHRYYEWSKESGVLWRDFAPELKEISGVDVAHRTGGGIDILVGEAERQAKEAYIDAMRAQAGDRPYDTEIIGRDEVQAMLPGIRLGQEVVGASYSPHDGDSNPLLLLRAMHQAFQNLGGRYYMEHRAENIRHDGHAFVVETRKQSFAGAKLVLACGHGIPKLAAMVGLKAPIRPQRGQVLITERVAATVDMPIGRVRQTNEGGFQIGNSEEDVEFDDWTTLEATRRIAGHAVKCFPQLAGVRLVRTWAGTRVLTPDKCAIYEESKAFPGAYVATSHSGVTLAAINARHIAAWIAEGETQPGFEQFSTDRFDVSKAA